MSRPTKKAKTKGRTVRSSLRAHRLNPRRTSAMAALYTGLDAYQCRYAVAHIIVSAMSDTCSEQLIDVRTMQPRDRHPAIFGTWQQINDGESILLVNDHDPLPLYFQFACEHAGTFQWQYLDQGPEIWRVRIDKGDYADPGFKPQRKTTCATTVPATFVQPLVLDTRPIFQRGETPCHAIDEAVESLIPGQSFVLLAPFEPAPLYKKLGAQGFSHKTTKEDDGTWRLEFRK